MQFFRSLLTLLPLWVGAAASTDTREDCVARCNRLDCKYATFQNGTCTLHQEYAHFRSCDDVLARHGGAARSGVYTLYNVRSTAHRRVYCKFVAGRAWLMVTRRASASEDFNRDWDSYKHGFGNPKANFWIGNDLLHTVTSERPHEVYIELINDENGTAHAQYDMFAVGSEDDNYRLTISGYSGDAGNSFETYDGKEFRTAQDSDAINRVINRRAGFWYQFNTDVHLTGMYRPGVYDSTLCGGQCVMTWRLFGGQWYGLQYAEMRIAPKQE